LPSKFQTRKLPQIHEIFLSFCFCFFFHGVKLGHDTRPGVPTIFPRRLALLYRTRVSLLGHFKWALQNPQARFTSLIQRSIAILFHITRQHVPLFVPQSLGFITVKMRIMCVHAYPSLLKKKKKGVIIRYPIPKFMLRFFS
jgi:hypothetical protein